MSPGEKIGAFFDLDGTLLPAPSLEWRFIGWLIAHDEIGGRDVARWLGHFLKNVWGDPRGATLANKTYLAGLRTSLAGDWQDSLAADSVPFFAEGLERIRWHLARGHRVFWASGTLGPLARVAVRRLSDEVVVCATELETCGGRWTGRVTGEHLRGQAKARAVRALALRYGLDLRESYAYGNTLADLAMLEMVGRPVAVNPRAALERIACSGSDARRWQVCVWQEAADKRGAIGTRQLCAVSPKDAR